MPVKKNSKKTLLYVFEGPDMCGKSSHVESVVKKLNEEGFKAASYKFPNYSGYFGKETIDFVNNFDYLKFKTSDEALDRIMDKFHYDYVNKLTSIEELQKVAKGKDVVVLDRFELSQLIYNLAWLEIIGYTKYGKFIDHKKKSRISSLKNRFVREVKEINDIFSNKFEIRYIMFKYSEMIQSISYRDRKDKIDNYDSNDFYREVVTMLYKLYTSPDDLELPFEDMKTGFCALDIYEKDIEHITNKIDLRIDTDDEFLKFASSSQKVEIKDLFKSYVENDICLSSVEDRFSSETISELNKGVYENIDRDLVNAIEYAIEKNKEA